MEVNVRKLVVLGSREKRRKKRKKEKKKEKKRLAGKGKKRKEKAINRWADYTNRLRRDPFARIYQAFVISFFNLFSVFSTIVSRSFDTRKFFFFPRSVHRLFLQLRIGLFVLQSVLSLVKVSHLACYFFLNTKLVEEILISFIIN